METRKRNIIIGKAGGNSGKASKNYKISLPAEWVRELGVTEDDREVLIVLENSEIKIKGGKEMNWNVIAEVQDTLAAGGTVDDATWEQYTEIAGIELEQHISQI